MCVTISYALNSVIILCIPYKEGSQMLATEAKLINNRHHLDFYSSPLWFATEAAKRFQISGTVLECCCGDGSISNVLEHHPDVSKVITNDIDFTKPADYHLDVTKAEAWDNLPECDYVITNPPFGNCAAPILINAHKKAKKAVIMFLLNSFLEACDDRYEFLDQHPPNHIVSLPRFCFRKDKKGEKWTTDNTTINIFVWDKSGEQSIKSVHKSKVLGYYRNPEKAISFEEVLLILKTTCKRKFINYN